MSTLSQKVAQQSLNNYTSTTKNRVNTPRSIEALKKCGFDAEELLPRTNTEILSYYKEKPQNEQAIKEIIKHFETRRLQKIELCRQEREKIKSAGDGSTHSFSAKMPRSSMVENEQKNLEAMQRKQQKEIEQMIQYEIQAQQTEKKNIRKSEMQKLREQQRQHEIEQKHRREQEQRLEKQLHLQERQRQHEEALEAEKQIKLQREFEIKMKDEQKKEEMRKMALQRDEEQRRKAQVVIQQREQEQLRLQSENEMKRFEMEQKERLRLQKIEEEKYQKHLEAMQKQQIHEEAIQKAKQKNEKELQFRLQEFEQKNMSSQQKRQMFELQKLHEVEQNRRLAQEKQQKIQQTLEQANIKQEQKKQVYLDTMQRAEERKQQLQLIHQAELESQRIQNEQNEFKRQQIKQKNDELLEIKTQELQQIQYQKDLNVQRVKQDQNTHQELKHIQRIMELKEKEENVKRIAKMNEYKRQQMHQKIEEDNFRTQVIKQQKDQVLREKFKVQQDVEKNKREMLQKFEQVKLGKLKADDLFPNQTQSIMNHEKYQGGSIGSQDNNGYTVQEVKKPVPKKKPQTAKVNLKLEGALEDLRLKQNKEMLNLLDKEQFNEAERDRMIEECHDNLERKRLEKIFGVERSKVQQAIIDMSNTHERQIQDVRRRYA